MHLLGLLLCVVFSVLVKGIIKIFKLIELGNVAKGANFKIKGVLNVNKTFPNRTTFFILVLKNRE